VTLEGSLTYKPVELAFGTSGLRGLVRDMTDLECYINTIGFLRFAAERDGLHRHEPVYLAGDLRSSTARIKRIVAAAIQDSGYQALHCGSIPIPALAYYGLIHASPCIMVTGSHIPADRNGIKFYKRAGEVLKADEPDIQAAVSEVRKELYAQAATESKFRADGSMRSVPELAIADEGARKAYLSRYLDVFEANSLAGKKIAVYQQSSVARDILVDMLLGMGAEVTAFGRSDEFIPIDTDNITLEDMARFRSFSREYPESFAVVSADGDSDRPIVIDENGFFHRGDMLGCVTARFLGVTFAAVPVICNDAVDEFCRVAGITLVKAKVGSPHVITAMVAADSQHQPAVAWEMNGGFLTAQDMAIHGNVLKALPTRDAALPIVCALQSAAQQNITLSEMFNRLPRRFASQGLIDNIPEAEIKKFRSLYGAIETMRTLATAIAGNGLGEIESINITDGLRMRFVSGDVLHLRPSANAPQFRVYTTADSPERALALARNAIAKDGYIIKILAAVASLT